MPFAISIPQLISDGSFDPDAFTAYLRRAQELGFESGEFRNRWSGTASQLSPLETLTFAADCTNRSHCRSTSTNGALVVAEDRAGGLKTAARLSPPAVRRPSGSPGG